MSDKIAVSIDSDLEDLIPGFLQNRQKDVEKIAEALSGSDYESLRSIGHNLKGVGGGYGFDQMSEIGAALEEAAKSSDQATIQEQLEKLRDYLARLEVVYE